MHVYLNYILKPMFILSGKTFHINFHVCKHTHDTSEYSSMEQCFSKNPKFFLSQNLNLYLLNLTRVTTTLFNLLSEIISVKSIKLQQQNVI